MATLVRKRNIEGSSPRSPEDCGEVVRLEPHDDPASVAHLLCHASRVEVNFPKFTDGRGFSIARLLRERHGYEGELRAVGHVARDHLYSMQAVGFDAFLLREGEDPVEALTGFEDFSTTYQKRVRLAPPGA